MLKTKPKTEESKCLKCGSSVTIREDTNIWNEKRWVMACPNCHSYYTSIDEIHWIPVIENNL